MLPEGGIGAKNANYRAFVTMSGKMNGMDGRKRPFPGHHPDDAACVHRHGGRPLAHPWLVARGAPATGFSQAGRKWRPAGSCLACHVRVAKPHHATVTPRLLDERRHLRIGHSSYKSERIAFVSLRPGRQEGPPFVDYGMRPGSLGRVPRHDYNVPPVERARGRRGVRVDGAKLDLVRARARTRKRPPGRGG